MGREGQEGSPSSKCLLQGEWYFPAYRENAPPKKVSYYAPIFEVVYQAFGEDRIIYGSNWPVTDRGGSYAEQFSIIHDFFAPEGKTVLRKLFALNARKFYGLK